MIHHGIIKTGVPFHKGGLTHDENYKRRTDETVI